MTNDKQLQKDILAELDWEPSVNAAHVGVAVENGVVTLTGHVGSFVEKDAAETAALRVKGVRGVVQDIEVKISFSAKRSDEDIVNSVLNVFRSSSVTLSENVKVEVENGCITLHGELNWEYQRASAERLARNIQGVNKVYNKLTIKPSAKPFEVKQKIEQALRRRAEVEASRISVEAKDGKVTLSGHANSWYERQAAEQAAWAAPGVTSVIDQIRIEPRM